MASLRVGAVVPKTEAEGPGARFAVWAQGCRIRCAGCCNPHLLPFTGGQELAVADLLARIRAVRTRIDGVSLLGGEPFDQATAMAELASGARELGLSVMTFTGYPREALEASLEAGVAALLAATDLLVDGPYDATLPETTRRWAGSANQRFHYLTPRLRPGVELAAAGEALRTVEVRIGADGKVRVNGWPTL